MILFDIQYSIIVCKIFIEYASLLQKKFEGTRVTIENFLAWKTKFDSEMIVLNKQKMELEAMKNKLTGKFLIYN